MRLTEEQAAAIRLTVNEPPASLIVCLTGGPGTGKTTTLRALLEAAGAAGLSAKCAAPSGKAAQRMEQATGRPASTLHRLMAMRPGMNAGEAIEADLLIVDEASMVDVPLMKATLAAAELGRVRTVLLVGDADQLPPVGPGQPFHDLLQSGVCPTVRLTQVHRQAAESGIIRAAHSIVAGSPPLYAPDFRLVACEELEDIPATVWATIRRAKMNPDTSQVLAPQRTTAGGVDAINEHIEAAREDGEGPPMVRKRFRVGTKVINTKNDYQREVFNGELGEVVEAVAGVGKSGKPKASADELLVRFANGDAHTFKGAAIKALQPAWALTVHKSQGSQWDDVIVVAHKSHSYMLTRRLLYVASTRAARRVFVVGQAEAVARAVRNTQDAKRDTWLAKRFARDAARRVEAELASRFEVAS